MWPWPVFKKPNSTHTVKWHLYIVRETLVPLCAVNERSLWNDHLLDLIFPLPKYACFLILKPFCMKNTKCCHASPKDLALDQCALSSRVNLISRTLFLLLLLRPRRNSYFFVQRKILAVGQGTRGLSYARTSASLPQCLLVMASH